VTNAKSPATAAAAGGGGETAAAGGGKDALGLNLPTGSDEDGS